MGTPARIALLVDAENAPASALPEVLTALAQHGTVPVRRAYADWARPELGPWTAALHPYAVRPVQQFAYTSGKNASDIALVIDALDLLHAGSVDAFALLSSDADFTPLVLRLLEGGASVHGFGEAKTPEPFVRACSRFTHVGGRGPAGLAHLVRTAVDGVRRDDGWAPLSAVGTRMGALGTFDPRAHGFRRLSDLVAALGCFEMRREATVVLVRSARG